MKRVGILYHPRVDAAEALACDLAAALPALGAEAWVASAWEEDQVRALAQGTDLALSVGGDGTILRSARAVAPLGIPLLGVNLGRLGFLTELSPFEAQKKLPELIDGAGWIEERAMLKAELLPHGRSPAVHALNDVVLARGALSRAVYVQAFVDGERLATYKGDGVIVATATGSTGYSLAVGGPIIYPEARDVLLTPIAAHLTFSNSIILPETIVLRFRVMTDHQAMMSIDGQIEMELKDGDEIKVERSPHLTRFLRVRDRHYFFATLTERLRYREGEPAVGL